MAPTLEERRIYVRKLFKLHGPGIKSGNGLTTCYMKLTKEDCIFLASTNQDAEVSADSYRKINGNHAAFLSSYIEDGRFSTTHQGIMLTSDYHLSDGNHRITAAAKALKDGETITMQVTIMDETVDQVAVFQAIDSGMGRTLPFRSGLTNQQSNKVTSILGILGLRRYHNTSKQDPQRQRALYEIIRPMADALSSASIKGVSVNCITAAALSYFGTQHEAHAIGVHNALKSKQTKHGMAGIIHAVESKLAHDAAYFKSKDIDDAKSRLIFARSCWMLHPKNVNKKSLIPWMDFNGEDILERRKVLFDIVAPFYPDAEEKNILSTEDPAFYALPESQAVMKKNGKKE